MKKDRSYSSFILHPSSFRRGRAAMRHTWTGPLVAVFLALGLLGAVPRAGRAAEQMPYEDTWKLTVQELAPRVGGLEVSFCLVKLTRDGRFAAEVIDALPAPLFR